MAVSLLLGELAFMTLGSICLGDDSNVSGIIFSSEMSGFGGASSLGSLLFS